MDKHFSVIIPLYNKAHTIKHTLTTVLNQTFQYFEIIIVDDGSTDNGVDIAFEFCSEKIKIVHQENQGVSVARNNGASVSRYPWLVFLDADDEMLPDYLKSANEVLSNNTEEIHMLGFGGFHKDMLSNSLNVNIIEKYLDKVKEVNYFINPDRMPHLGGCVIRKDIFNQCRGFPIGIKVSEDVCLLLKVALTGKFFYCGKLTHVYVGNVEGQVTTARKNKIEENRKDEAVVYNEIYNLWSRNMRNWLVPIFLKYKIRHFFFLFLKQEDYKSISILILNMSVELKELLGNGFIRLVDKRRWKLFCIIYLLFTKLVWRMHSYPRVGQKIRQEEMLKRRYIN